MSDLSKVKRDGKGHFIKGSYYAHWTGKTFSDEHMTNLKNRPSNRGVKKNFSPESKEKQLKQLEDMRSRHTDDFRSKEVREKFNIHRYDDIPNHLMPKIVLEEIRMGLLTWRDPANDKPSQDVSKIVGVNEVVYGG